MQKYFSENEILKLVDAFESGTIARQDWRHAEHLTVALFYLSRHDFETALGKMRGGIFNLLKSFGIDLSKEMPYHETLTVFWLQTVDGFRTSKSGVSMPEICHQLAANFDKDYPLRFYSRELLFSDEARARFVEADLTEIS
ncbi:MAG: hypothetical protein ABJA66_02260 [Actinomycetota bacterium]